MEIEVKKVEERQVAYIYHKGSYEELGELIGSVVRWLDTKDLQIAGPPFCIYYNSPKEVPPEELEYEVGIPFLGEAEEENEIKIDKIPEGEVISTVHKGPYSGNEEIYMALVDYAMENGFEIIETPMEIYLNNPMEVAESELLTEIQFPVMKKLKPQITL